MKILHIRFCNLNSLAGSWSIDLTSPEYSSDGIFAITGPTGAGKTTILDAVCLALYGQTPRLRLVTKKTNEIMTRQTGECWAEVEFSTAKGKFRCHWSQHRARKSAQGDLQPQKHEIIDCSNNKVIESKIRMVGEKVIAVTGMTFDQFTRSILLAQGDFDTFLKAKPDERAPILEQITGTEMYSRISRKVHERKSEEQLRSEQLIRECDGFMPLTTEQLVEINLRLRELAEKAQASEKNILHHRNLLEWHTTQANLHVKIAAQTEQAAIKAKNWQGLEPQRQQFARAEKARAIEPAYTRLDEQRTFQTKEQGDLKECKALLEKILKDSQNTTHAKAEADKQLAAGKIEQKNLEGILREVRGLDQRIHLLREQKAELDNELVKEAQTHATLKHSLSEQHKSIVNFEAELEQLERYRETHTEDKKLVEEFSGIRQHIAQYAQLSEKNIAVTELISTLQNNLTRYEQHVKNQKQKTDALQGTQNTLEQNDTDTRKKLAELLNGESQEQLYSRIHLLQEQRPQVERASTFLEQRSKVKNELQALLTIEKSSTDKQQSVKIQQLQIQKECALRAQSVDKQQQIVILATKIKNYEHEREQLRTDVPCPLCGALDHPFRHSPTPLTTVEQTLLNSERKLLQDAQKHESLLQAELAALHVEIEHNLQTQTEKKQSVEDLGAKISDLCELLEIQPDTQLATTLTLRAENLEFELKHLQDKRLKIDNLKANIEKITSQQAILSHTTHTAEHELQKLLLEQQNSFEQLRLKQSESNQQQRELTDRYQFISRLLAPYTHIQITATNHDELLIAIDSRRKQWIECEENLKKLTLQIQQLRADTTMRQALIEKQESICKEKKSSVTKLTANIASLFGQRNTIFADKNPDTVEQQMQEKIVKSEYTVNELQRSLSSLQQKHATLSEREEALGHRIEERGLYLQQILGDFQNGLHEAGFPDEAEFLSSRMQSAKYSELSARIQQTQKELEESKTILQSLQSALGEELSRKLTDLTAAEITTILQDLSTQHSTSQQETGALTQQLTENEKQQERHTEKLGQLTAQNKELARWARLHELIGSNDGKKFRNFAQGLTFEIMISHANTSLQKMSDRYLLVRDPAQPLELHVIDNYQAGEIRSTKNLSGGESFIVSMALALGLSSMASHNVQVDSLFLDEGFGTLDEESLQTALDTLSGLHQNGKLIGIISHVNGLQERIATQIKVTRGLGGLSTLSGPGAGRWHSRQDI